MYCPRCGKENPKGARFCMHCGADLREYKVEISPKIEVSPKIHAEAKAEGIPYPKWRPKVEKYAEIESEGKLPVYKKFAKFDGKPFCPQCGNYDSLIYICGKIEIEKGYANLYNLYECLACGKKVLTIERVERIIVETPKECYILDKEKVSIYEELPKCFDSNMCPECYSIDSLEDVSSPNSLGEKIFWTLFLSESLHLYRCKVCGKRLLVKMR